MHHGNAKLSRFACFSLFDRRCYDDFSVNRLPCTTIKAVNSHFLVIFTLIAFAATFLNVAQVLAWYTVPVHDGSSCRRQSNIAMYCQLSSQKWICHIHIHPSTSKNPDICILICIKSSLMTTYPVCYDTSLHTR